MENNYENNYQNDSSAETEFLQTPVQEQPVVKQPKKLPKIVWILAAVAVVAVIAVIIIVSVLGNTYKTPIEAAEKLLNSTSVEKIINNAPSVLNGFGESEAAKIIKILKKSDQYKDFLEDAEDGYADTIEDRKDEYGKNFKMNLKIDDKEKLEKEDNKEFRDQLRNIAKLGEQLDDMSSDDYENLADSIGISKSEAKELVKALQSFCKKCKSADVTAGYELSVITSITGSEVDEPDEDELKIRVFKVDGRWVPDVFSLLSDLGMGMGSIGGLIGSMGTMPGF